MTFSAKIVAGGVLTFFMLGLSHLFQQGQFLAPFPFISEFTLLITLFVVFEAIRVFSWKSIPFITYALTGTLAGRFLWEILLPLDDIIYLFEQTSFIDAVLLIHFISLILCIVFISSWIQSKTLKWVHLSFIPFLIAIVLINGSYLLFVWYVLYGVLCLVTLKDDETSDTALKPSLELFVGLGLIYLMSIISIVFS